MASQTKRIIAGAQWTKLIHADNRDCLTLIHAYGTVEIAIAEGELPAPSVTRGHAISGAHQVQIQGRDIVWAKGAGVEVCATNLKFMPTFNGFGASSGGVGPTDPTPLIATDADGNTVTLLDADGNPVTIEE